MSDAPNHTVDTNEIGGIGMARDGMPCGGDAFEAICEMLHYDWGYKTVCTDLSYGCSGCAKHASNGGKCGEVRVEDGKSQL